jgi:hypothetical protein
MRGEWRPIDTRKYFCGIVRVKLQTRNVTYRAVYSSQLFCGAECNLQLPLIIFAVRRRNVATGERRAARTRKSITVRAGTSIEARTYVNGAAHTRLGSNKLKITRLLTLIFVTAGCPAMAHQLALTKIRIPSEGLRTSTAK